MARYERYVRFAPVAAQGDSVEKLTAREYEVLDLLAEGLLTPDVAR